MSNITKNDTNDIILDKIQLIVKEMNKGFKEMHEGFSRMHKGFEEMHQKFAEIDKRFEQVDKRFEQVNERLDRHEERLNNHDKQFESLRKILLNIEYEVTTKIPALFDGYNANNDHYEDLEKRVSKLEEQEGFNSLKISILEDKIG